MVEVARIPAEVWKAVAQLPREVRAAIGYQAALHEAQRPPCYMAANLAPEKDDRQLVLPGT